MQRRRKSNGGRRGVGCPRRRAVGRCGRRRGARRARSRRIPVIEQGQQLRRAITAVFDSWKSPRAQVYRQTYGIPDDLGTAVNVVQMVFGNKGDRSATGVCFTRDPSTGEQGVYGE